jgi:hypothetical protein
VLTAATSRVMIGAAAIFGKPALLQAARERKTRVRQSTFSSWRDLLIIDLLRSMVNRVNLAVRSASCSAHNNRFLTFGHSTNSGQHTCQTLSFNVCQSRRANSADPRQIINRTKRSLGAQIGDLPGQIRPNVDDLLQLIGAGAVDVYTMSGWRLARMGRPWLRRINRWRRCVRRC